MSNIYIYVPNIYHSPYIYIYSVLRNVLHIYICMQCISPCDVPWLHVLQIIHPSNVIHIVFFHCSKNVRMSQDSLIDLQREYPHGSEGFFSNPHGYILWLILIFPSRSCSQVFKVGGGSYKFLTQQPTNSFLFGDTKQTRFMRGRRQYQQFDDDKENIKSNQPN